MDLALFYIWLKQGHFLFFFFFFFFFEFQKKIIFTILGITFEIAIKKVVRRNYPK